MIYLLIALLVSALSGILAHRLAEQKQRAQKPWIIASVLLVFPVFILSVLPSKQIQRYQ